MFDLMSQHRTVYAIDLPGYGTSERSDRLYTPRLMTDAILDLGTYIRTKHSDQPIGMCTRDVIDRPSLAVTIRNRQIVTVSLR